MPDNTPNPKPVVSGNLFSKVPNTNYITYNNNTTSSDKINVFGNTSMYGSIDALQKQIEILENEMRKMADVMEALLGGEHVLVAKYHRGYEIMIIDTRKPGVPHTDDLIAIGPFEDYTAANAVCAKLDAVGVQWSHIRLIDEFSTEYP